MRATDFFNDVENTPMSGFDPALTLNPYTAERTRKLARTGDPNRWAMAG